MRLADRVVVVTGASGIAAAGARRFAAEGASVFVVSLDDGQCQELASEIGSPESWAAADLTDEAETVTAFKACTDILRLWPQDFAQKIPGLPKGVFTLEAAPMFLGVGYILGYGVSAIMVAGSLISAMVFIPLIAHFGQYIPTPLFPETTLPIAPKAANKKP